MTSLPRLFRTRSSRATPRVRPDRPNDCFSALKEGLDDFLLDADVSVFVGLFYAVAESRCSR